MSARFFLEFRWYHGVIFVLRFISKVFLFFGGFKMIKITLPDGSIKEIENGTLDLTYELFDVAGDGVSNDYYGIKAVHDFANWEYITKGILLTVHGYVGEGALKLGLHGLGMV